MRKNCSSRKEFRWKLTGKLVKDVISLPSIVAVSSSSVPWKLGSKVNAFRSIFLTVDLPPPVGPTSITPCLTRRVSLNWTTFSTWGDHLWYDNSRSATPIAFCEVRKEIKIKCKGQMADRKLMNRNEGIEMKEWKWRNGNEGMEIKEWK